MFSTTKSYNVTLIDFVIERSCIKSFLCSYLYTSCIIVSLFILVFFLRLCVFLYPFYAAVTPNCPLLGSIKVPLIYSATVKCEMRSFIHH